MNSQTPQGPDPTDNRTDDSRLVGVLIKVALLTLLYQAGTAVMAPEPPLPYEARTYAVGDTLADVALLGADGSKTTLSSVSAGQCRLLVVFDDACQFCRRLAPDWSDRTVLEDGTKVTWIALPGEAEAPAQFITEFRLPVEWYRLETQGDAEALGVYGTPMVVMMGPDRTYLGEAAKDPDSLQPYSECAG